jgi:hypothetical protein
VTILLCYCRGKEERQPPGRVENRVESSAI